ncbi:hypothetical protein LbFV_ORF10 [Leptopilina boulardi filamentous virus]|uniref:C2H2-type domain-containing protein n=1 Tax=Leptopilina boulardi filamentous virus TaxID=552509 RepID=A0A1S5YCZ0_9VIRU|nr:hypothetical protein LbFV_ORF10 [Leptopilina boulardi filamentous virus]AQQ79930.1 hypothetical protein LbFV_ORF10 [Leptopilina boulardi filamentous virus]
MPFIPEEMPFISNLLSSSDVFPKNNNNIIKDLDFSSDNGRIVCDKCDKFMPVKRFKKHELICTGEMCKYCRKKFATKTTLKTHITRSCPKMF